MTEFKVVRAQVFDPIALPDGIGYPPRVEALVEGLDLHSPTEVLSRDEWLITRYGEYFYLFYHEGELGQKPVYDTEHNEESLTFHEGHVNTSSLLPEPIFPVTVAVHGESGVWRDYFVPVSVVDGWIDTFEAERAHPLGRWSLVASSEWARRGQIVFELHFARHDERPLRAEAARRPR